MTNTPGDNSEPSVRTCHCCGLVQVVPAITSRKRRVCCARCETTFPTRSSRRRSHSATFAIALSALIVYPFAIHLPMIRLEEMGRHNEASIFDGTATLLADGEIFVGVIVLFCSIILPVAKLVGLLMLSWGDRFIRAARHRAWTYRLIEWTGRWGMLDVLAVAILVGAVKLGSSIELTAGPGAAAFAVVVILSLLASATFDPHALWAEGTESSIDASPESPSLPNAEPA